ncbi:MAG: type IV pilus biogenesis/stability protein PilW [Gallionellaceae bacterium]|nr:type IV pilus biogenesis/stability protein PilW [Gallionellaceae bacterium]
MKLFMIFLLTVGVVGCASQGGGSAGTPAQSISRSQQIAKIHTELAASYFERGQFDIALQEIDVALKSESSYAPAFNVRGLIRMALREDQQADEDFRRSLQIDSADSSAHNNYGWFLCQRGRESEAVAEFLAAVKNPLYTTPEKAYVNAGICAKKINKFKEAEEYLQRALVRQPGFPDALYGMADLSFATRDYAGAKSYFLRFLQKQTELSAENLWLAVRIERKVGDRNSEESYALQLRKRYPDARETQLLLKGE